MTTFRSNSSAGFRLSRPLRQTLLCLLVSLLAAPPPAVAGTVTWNGGAGNWSDSNWTGVVHYPGSGVEDVTIGPGSSNVLALDVTASINTLNLGASSIVNSNAGKTLTVAGDVTSAGRLQFSNQSMGSVGGNLSNTRLLSLDNSSVVSVGGTLVNSSSVSLQNMSQLTASSSFNNSGGFVTVYSGALLSAKGFNNTGGYLYGANGVADFRGGAFTNLDSTNGTLTGGLLNLTNSQLLYDAGAGSFGGDIHNFVNTKLTLSGGGAALLYGPNGAQSDPLGTLSSLSHSQLVLDSIATRTLHPDAGVLTLANSTFVTVSGASAAVDGTVNIDNSYLFIKDSGIGGSITARGLTNNGNISVEANSIADFRSGGTGTFTNLDSATGILNGGAWQLNGTLLYDPSAGVHGGDILGLQNADVILTGSASMSYGPGATNGLTKLASIDGSQLKLDGMATLYVQPDGGTLTLTTADGNTSTGITVQDYSSLTINGNLSAPAPASPFAYSSVGLYSGTLNVTGNYQQGGSSWSGSSTTVNGGSTLTIGGSMTLGSPTDNNVYLSSFYGGVVTAKGLTNYGVITSDFGTTMDFRGGALTNYDAATSSLIGGDYHIGGQLLFDPPGGGDGHIRLVNEGQSISLEASFAQISYGAAGTDALGQLQDIRGTFGVAGNAVLNAAPLSGILTVANTGALNVNTNWGGGAIYLTGSLVNNGSVWMDSSVGSASISTTGSLTNNNLLNYVAYSAISTGTGLVNNGLIFSDGYGGNTLDITGDVTNGSTGVIDLTGGDTLIVRGEFTNQGQVLVANGAVLAGLGVAYTQTGGTTFVDAGGTLSAATIELEGGSISGGGAYDGNVVNDAGTIAPGDPAILQITGDLTQHFAGMMELQFAGLAPDQYDQVTVGGNVSLDGTLAVDLINGYIPTLGDLFTILSWGGNLTGNFSTFVFPTFGNGLTFLEIVNASNIQLEVVNGSQAPEPGILVLFGLTTLLAGAFAYKRRRF